MAVFLKKFSTLNGAVEPFLTFFYLVVERGKHPYFAALQPNEFISVVNRTVAVEAGEVATKFFVLRLFEPERDNLVKQFRFVLLG